MPTLGQQGGVEPDGSGEEEEPPWARAWTRDWVDMLEVSAATFVLNAILGVLDGDNKDDVELMLTWLLGKGDLVEARHPADPRLTPLVEQLMAAQKRPDHFGIDRRKRSPEASKRRAEDLERAADTLREILSHEKKADSSYLEWLCEISEEQLRKLTEEAESKRSSVALEKGEGDGRAAAKALSDTSEDEARDRDKFAVPLAVLACVHDVLDKRRRPRTRPHAQSKGDRSGDEGSTPRPTRAKEAELLKRVEDLLKAYPEYSS